MRYPIRLWRVALVGSVAVGTVLSVTGTGLAAHEHGVRLHGAAARMHAMIAATRQHGPDVVKPAAGPRRGDDDGDLADQFAQYDNERTAPAGFVKGDALASAARQAAMMPTAGGAWQQFTNQPYNAQPSNYTDPFWGNQGAGFSLVGGRITALATTRNGAWFAGAADGGVWRSLDQGKNWKPVFDGMPSLSIGSLAVDPVGGSLWVGTGEANTSGDSYAGTGVYRSFNGGNNWQRVGNTKSGGNPLVDHTVFRVTFDQKGDAYAATNNGLFRLARGARHWTEVLDPAGVKDFPPYDQQVTDVAVVPGSSGRDVIAAIGWHGPGNTANNGFYESTNSGRTFGKVTPTGAINASDIGRTTFAYSAHGNKLYATVQSPTAQGAGAPTVLQGIFVASGSPAKVTGPWKKIADAAKLTASGSASPSFGKPGVQTWYNQDLAVDPHNKNHVYAGLEEVYESTNGGKTWITASPYWNYNFKCDSATPPTCPNTTHPDQHAMMITDGKIVIGNDGGVYSRPLSDAAENGHWTDLNATLRDLQYYDARAGQLAHHATAVWGGLQDNGSSLVASNTTQQVEPAGGDGFDVIVDPANANNLVGEYTEGTVYLSTDGGHSFTNATPTCVGQQIVGVTPTRKDCDPGARFVTPLAPDGQNVNTWVLGGQFVWVSTDGWSTTCTVTACSWKPVYNLGTGDAATAVASVNGGSTIYAAWVAGGGNPGPTFARGIATNEGGTWHQVNMTGLPNRYIAGLTIDPSNPAHAYAVFSGFSRNWIPGGGVGHVFETTDGGQTWTNISGNLPDIPADALVLGHGKLALGTDQGVYTALVGQGAATKWSRLGSGLPNAVVDDLTAGPRGFIYAATHGRGVWRIKF